MSNTATDLKEIPMDWDSYFSRVNDLPASIRLNLALNQIAPIPGLPKLLWCGVKLQKPDENGFTTNEEFQTICDIEDAIDAALTGINALFTAALKSDGKLELFFYAPTNEGYENLVQQAMMNFPEYQYATDSSEEQDWKTYLEFLYPNHYEYKCIQNTKVLRQLQQSGDVFELEREVDHWIYFNAEQDLNTFVEEVNTSGFRVLSQDKHDREDFPYVLNISRKNTVLPHEVNHYVWELVETAEKHKGFYDGWGCPVAKSEE